MVTFIHVIVYAVHISECNVKNIAEAFCDVFPGYPSINSQEYINKLFIAIGFGGKAFAYKRQ